jgi:hypothetical protein
MDGSNQPRAAAFGIPQTPIARSSYLNLKRNMGVIAFSQNPEDESFDGEIRVPFSLTSALPGIPNPASE